MEEKHQTGHSSRGSSSTTVEAASWMMKKYQDAGGGVMPKGRESGKAAGPRLGLASEERGSAVSGCFVLGALLCCLHWAYRLFPMRRGEIEA